jgi:hypothetical protein
LITNLPRGVLENEVVFMDLCRCRKCGSEKSWILSGNPQTNTKGGIFCKQCNERLAEIKLTKHGEFATVKPPVPQLK